MSKNINNSHQNAQHPDRFIMFEKAVNFRDIGGYLTKDGSVVRWGHIYRAGQLSRLTAGDQAKLAQLGMRLVYDLRSDSEVAAKPDDLGDSAEITYIHSPMTDPSHVSRGKALLQIILHRRSFEQMMLEGYQRTILETNAHIIGDFLRRIADGAAPAVVHCTAGKDRTGVTIALLLRLLGVDEADVVADFALSGQFVDVFARGFEGSKELKHLRRMGYADEALRPLFDAPAHRLQTTLAHVTAQYGSIPNYLQQRANVDLATQQQLRDLLLEKP